ncbi:succinyl-diaminopimelate desuccinylase [Thermopetrobacter sp. TC1]|uniref:succinyl-diaminopimelate desuccinylase n=1 Tax=Thermopetrobacter sp. TC1 TaxID=1495045 RepID=UPI00056F231E|nr:succinyl-diaminopimelate desuccinylase [Thermopetrobacter sp. TC1]
MMTAATPHETDPVALTQALIRCPSVTPEDAGALEVLEVLLENAGFACHRLTFTEEGTAPVHNLFARIGEGGPHLCFAGHTDVVPPGDEAAWLHPPFEAVIDHGVLYGRGAADMKSGVAAFAAAAVDWARAHLENGRPLPGSVSLLITGDEEGPAINGTRKVLAWLQQQGHLPDAALVGEPTCSEELGDTIKNGRRGSINLFITAEGVQGHTAYPEKALNPVHALARLVDRMASARLDEGTDHFQPSTVAFSTFDVGNPATNVIPAQAKAVCNVRFNTLHTGADIERWAHVLAEEVARETGARFFIDAVISGEAFITEGGPIVDVVRKAVQAETGLTPALSTGGGTSDARFIRQYCPVVEFGVVNETIHQVNERVPVEDIKRLKRIYARVIDLFMNSEQT